ncbi:MAG: hypothetical protein KGJ89_00345 [Patescibacteria group bacterium]|nr:hypothetical protein [Patescibacteria group bacterium]MDE2014970.1 hypothetical protein [Patescibacteria group bacterium]MDE2226399.1 hypothetical protein [Patescibacteria group bacterium]
MAKPTAIVSGAGWIGSFASKLEKALRNLGASDEQIHELVKDGEAPDALVEKIADVLAEAMQAAKNIFCVIVYYSLTLSRMIAAGKYDWVNSDITEEHFPVLRANRGKEKVVVELIHFNRDIDSDGAVRGLDRMGFRPAELPELLAFGAAYREKQREFPIVALGPNSVWRGRRGDRFVVCLGRGSGGRVLYLGCFDGGWISICRFAAVRKSI